MRRSDPQEARVEHVRHLGGAAATDVAVVMGRTCAAAKAFAADTGQWQLPTPRRCRLRSLSYVVRLAEALSL